MSFLELFQYPPGSGPALLAGTLLLQYCAARFACRTSTWRLPDSGHVADLVTAVVGVTGEVVVDCAANDVSWVSGSGLGRKRFRSTKQKNSGTPCGIYGSISSSCLEKKLRHVGLSSVSIPDHKRRRGDQDGWWVQSCSHQDWSGVIPWGFVQAPVSRLACSF